MIADNSPGLGNERHTRAAYDSKSKYGQSNTLTCMTDPADTPRQLESKSRRGRIVAGLLQFLFNYL